MSINYQYKAPQTHAGAMRTPVVFYEYRSTGPDPTQSEGVELYSCFAEVYSPSMKDLEVMKSSGTSEGVTIRVRDTKGQYVPSNKHRVELRDYRYEGKVFDIIDVRHDFDRNDFITIVLRYTS